MARWTREAFGTAVPLATVTWGHAGRRAAGRSHGVTAGQSPLPLKHGPSRQTASVPDAVTKCGRVRGHAILISPWNALAPR